MINSGISFSNWSRSCRFCARLQEIQRQAVILMCKSKMIAALAIPKTRGSMLEIALALRRNPVTQDRPARVSGCTIWLFFPLRVKKPPRQNLAPA
jgi:hypothetical protein